MSDKKMIKLPESELEVMQAIWALNEEGEKFVSAGLIMKLITENSSGRKKLAVIIAAAVTANIILFVSGAVGFAKVTESTLSMAAAAVILPFLPGNLIKLVLTVFLAGKFRNIIGAYLKK